MSLPSPLFVVTANFTDDGAPAYLRADGSWGRQLQEASTGDEADQERRAGEHAADDQRMVCDPYIFKVAVSDGAIDPLTTREAIRSQGPTTRLRRPD